MYDYDDIDEEFHDDIPVGDTPDPDKLSPNSLAFIALCNEYCAALESAATMQKANLIDAMLRLLPRIYITAADISPMLTFGEGGYIAPALEEEAYDQIRNSVASVLGEDDIFLDTFVEDMKYSDTPIASSVSELLADLFQVFYDLLQTCREAPNQLINESLDAVRESFADYWSQTLTNALRAVNAIKYS